MLGAVEQAQNDAPRTAGGTVPGVVPRATAQGSREWSFTATLRSDSNAKLSAIPAPNPEEKDRLIVMPRWKDSCRLMFRAKAGVTGSVTREPGRRVVGGVKLAVFQRVPWSTRGIFGTRSESPRVVARAAPGVAPVRSLYLAPGHVHSGPGTQASAAAFKAAADRKWRGESGQQESLLVLELADGNHDDVDNDPDAKKTQGQQPNNPGPDFAHVEPVHT